MGLEGYSAIYEKFGVPIDRQMELDTLTFNRLLRDALVLRLRETEEGQNYLHDCWRFEQTEPDLTALRDFQQKTKH